MVIENNISTFDRKAKIDHFISEGQGHKFSLFLTCRTRGPEGPESLT